MAPRLYEVLGVEADATPSQIKKAYHAKALQCHPDKVGPAGEAEFKRVNEAYTILSNPDKRTFYDQHGDRGIELMNNGLAESFAEEQGLHTFLLFAIVLFLFSLVCWIAAVSCVASKLDGHISSSWGVTLTALWIWDAAVGITVVGALNMLLKKKDGRTQHIGTIWSLVAILLLILWQALVVANLDHDGATMRWMAAMAPALFVVLVSAVLGVRNALPGAIRESLVQSDYSTPCDVVAILCLRKLLNLLVPVVTLFLIGGRADRDFNDVTWVGVFTPVFVWAAVYIISSWMVLLRAAPIWTVGNLFESVFRIALPVTSVALCAVRADRGEGMSAGGCLAPFIAFLCIMTFVSCVMLCALAAIVKGNISEGTYSPVPDGDEDLPPRTAAAV